MESLDEIFSEFPEVFEVERNKSINRNVIQTLYDLLKGQFTKNELRNLC